MPDNAQEQAIEIYNNHSLSGVMPASRIRDPDTALVNENRSRTMLPQVRELYSAMLAYDRLKHSAFLRLQAWSAVEAGWLNIMNADRYHSFPAPCDPMLPQA